MYPLFLFVISYQFWALINEVFFKLLNTSKTFRSLKGNWLTSKGGTED